MLKHRKILKISKKKTGITRKRSKHASKKKKMSEFGEVQKKKSCFKHMGSNGHFSVLFSKVQNLNPPYRWIQTSKGRRGLKCFLNIFLTKTPHLRTKSLFSNLYFLIHLCIYFIFCLKIIYKSISRLKTSVFYVKTHILILISKKYKQKKTKKNKQVNEN